MNKQFIFNVNILVNAESMEDAQQYVSWDLSDGRNTSSHQIISSKEAGLEDIKPLIGMEHIDPIMAGLLQPFAPAPSEHILGPIQEWGIVFEALKQQGDMNPNPPTLQTVMVRAVKEGWREEIRSQQPWESYQDHKVRLLFNACKKIRNAHTFRIPLSLEELNALRAYGEEEALKEYDRISAENDMSNKSSWYASVEAQAKQELMDIPGKIFSIPTSPVLKYTDEQRLDIEDELKRNFGNMRAAAYPDQHDHTSNPNTAYPNMATLGKEIIYELMVNGFLVQWTGLNDDEWINIHSKKPENSRRFDKNGDTWELDWLTGIAVNIGIPL